MSVKRRVLKRRRDKIRQHYWVSSFIYKNPVSRFDITEQTRKRIDSEVNSWGNKRVSSFLRKRDDLSKERLEDFQRDELIAAAEVKSLLEGLYVLRSKGKLNRDGAVNMYKFGVSLAQRERLLETIGDEINEREAKVKGSVGEMKSPKAKIRATQRFFRKLEKEQPSLNLPVVYAGEKGRGDYKNHKGSNRGEKSGNESSDNFIKDLKEIAKTVASTRITEAKTAKDVGDAISKQAKAIERRTAFEEQQMRERPFRIAEESYRLKKSAEDAQREAIRIAKREHEENVLQSFRKSRRYLKKALNDGDINREEYDSLLKSLKRETFSR